MVLVLRRFQEEREQWEEERRTLEENERQLREEKTALEDALARMAEEVEMARAEQNEAPKVPAKMDDKAVRTHHEKHLALLSQLDEYRSDLRQEQSRSRALEKRACAAEADVLAWRASCPERGALALDRDLDLDLDLTQRARSPGAAAAAAPEEHRREIASLQDESTRLREELHREKQRVMELKQAALQRKAAWREELITLTEEIEQKQRLEEEVVELRQSQARLREELRAGASMAVGSGHRSAARRMSAPIPPSAGHRQDSRSGLEEMQQLSRTVGVQLVAVEQELARQVKKTGLYAQIVGNFLQEALEPLSVLRQVCRHIAATGEAGDTIWMSQVPGLFEAGEDASACLGKTVTFLRFAAAASEAQHRRRQRDASVLRGIEETAEYAKGWLTSALSN